MKFSLIVSVSFFFFFFDRLFCYAGLFFPDRSKQSSICKFNHFIRVPLLPTSALFFLWDNSKQPPLPLSPLPPSCRCPGYSPGAPQSQQTSFPAIRLTSPRMALVSSCTMLFSPTCWSPLKALLSASSLLFCRTEIHLRRDVHS